MDISITDIDKKEYVDILDQVAVAEVQDRDPKKADEE